MRSRRLERLIVLEGIDGAGTTTQARRLVDRIAGEGHRVFGTSEPTAGVIGKLVRRVLAGEVGVTPETTAYLFATDRWEHVFGAGGMIERHDAGDIVVCDRYFYSSLAYQTLECPTELVEGLNARFPLPGLLIFVDLPTELGERRLADRVHREIYEKTDVQIAVRERYLREIARAAEATTTVTISGSDSEEEVHRNIWEAVRDSSILRI